jgi:methionine-rich copper-binding protein CopC
MTIMRTIAGRALRASVLSPVSWSALRPCPCASSTANAAADSTVTASPASLTLSFSEGIETAFSAVTLTGPQQNAIATGKLARSGNKAQIVPLTHRCPRGVYR